MAGNNQAALGVVCAQTKVIFPFKTSNNLCHAWKIVANHVMLMGKSSSFEIYEPPHDKTNKVAYAPSEYSDQSEHPPSLIRVFSVRMKKALVRSYPLSAQRRL